MGDWRLNDLLLLVSVMAKETVSYRTVTGVMNSEDRKMESGGNFHKQLFVFEIHLGT